MSFTSGTGSVFAELLEELALLGGEVLRDDDAHEHVEVAAAPAAERGDALALARAARCPDCVPSGTASFVLPPSSVGTSSVRAEGRLRHAHRHLAEEAACRRA